MLSFSPAAGLGTRPALRDGARSISYRQLPALVEAEGGWLAWSGARRFGLLADNGCAWALTDLALARRGFLHVPLPAYFTPGQMAHVLDDAGIDAVITDQPATLESLALGFSPAGFSAQTGLALWRRPAPAGSSPIPPGTVKITYTSGSTSEPKGVCLSAALIEAVAHSLANATAGLGLKKHLCLLPLPTLLENVAGVYAALLSGATCEIPSLAETGMSYGNLQPGRLTATVAAREPHSLILVPELLRVLVHAAVMGWTPPASLRYIAVGGALVSPELLATAARLGLPVYEGYGLSECGSVVCLNTPGSNRPGSVGRPLPHVQVRLDAEGQILVRNAGMLGYLGDPPRGSGDEIATGDLGSIDADGFVQVRGRLKNLLITSLGRNIAPEWVERELQQEPEIGSAIVVGEARPWLAALISPTAAGSTPARIEAAVARANRRLPDYAQVRSWSLPAEPFTFANGALTANGRLRRAHILRENDPVIRHLYRDTTTLEESCA
ncbi:MAG: AMP-binding protein [Chromatiales bacterium]|nr:AMP-binding protein [Chromatiales bacterium]